MFVTGATGFVGSYLVPELVNAGYQVIGLSRSDAGAQALNLAGAEVCRGDVNDLERLRSAAEAAGAVIHTAFNHDFTNLKQNSENDRRVIETLGAALIGSDRPLIITSGTGLIRSKQGSLARETDDHVSSAEFARAATEEAADELIAQGARVMVMRLLQVHDTRHQGRIAQHILLARQKGRVAWARAGTAFRQFTSRTPSGLSGWRLKAGKQAHATMWSASREFLFAT